MFAAHLGPGVAAARITPVLVFMLVGACQRVPFDEDDDGASNVDSGESESEGESDSEPTTGPQQPPPDFTPVYDCEPSGTPACPSGQKCTAVSEGGLQNHFKCVPDDGELRAAPVLRDNLARMLAVLPAFTHPDGDVALLGDSQRGLVTPAALAVRCGTSLPQGTDYNAPASGLFRRAWGPWTLLWNAGGLGMPQQVGHIHGDWLGYELSLGGERVVVDAGVGTYEVGPERAYARSTRAHNTVTVGPGDRDQHELWASHRIGGRGELCDLSFGTSELSAGVRGFRAAAVHHRRLAWDGRVLRCIDRVVPDHGEPVPATMRIHLPRTCTVAADGPLVRVTTPAGRNFAIRGPVDLRWQTTAVPGWSAMSSPAPRHCLALPVGSAGLEVAFALEP